MTRASKANGPPKIGWLKIQDRAETPNWLAEFRAGLAGLGYVEGRSFILEERYADGAASRLTSLSEELVRAGCTVIVATSQPAVDAARKVTTSIPIVGRITDDPVQAGIAASLAQPGRNVTGIYSLLEATSGKRLALLQQAAPVGRRVGVLLTLDRGATPAWLAETEIAARSLGLALEIFDLRTRDDLERAFEQAVEKKIDGIITFRNPTIVTHYRRLLELTAERRIPGIYDAREFVEAGGLMSYGPNIDAIFRRAAFYVDRILKGTPPAELPIEQPNKLDLVVNAKTAKTMGLELPISILAAADDVIE